MPPIQSKAAAIAPSTDAQNIRCGTGASILPPAVIESITNEPESDDVMKNTNTNKIAINDKILDKGNSSSIWNIAKGTSVKPLVPNAPTPLTT